MKGIKNLSITTLLKSFLVILISLILIIMTMWINLIRYFRTEYGVGTGRLTLDYCFIEKSR